MSSITDARALVRSLVQPFILRRRKHDVLTQLPPKIDLIAYLCTHAKSRDKNNVSKHSNQSYLEHIENVKYGKGERVGSLHKRNASVFEEEEEEKQQKFVEEMKIPDCYSHWQGQLYVS